MRRAYDHLVEQLSAARSNKVGFQWKELLAIAEQEQVNVLQPLIYDDEKLKETMDMNHKYSRFTSGWISPQFKVIYGARPTNSNPQYETVFDPPTGFFNRFTMERKSLPKQEDRMLFVGKIATRFHRLMSQQRVYMDAELKKILSWIDS